MAIGGVETVALKAGGKLGRYELRSVVGTGGMAVVYRAYDPVIDREVAIKVLPPDLAREEIYRRRFHEEARALGRVQHPNLVRIYAVGEEQGVSFYAMELVDGISLSRALKTWGPVQAKGAVAIFRQFLRGLHACHGAKIIHRDVKPSNIMLASSGRVILMDFGLARRVDRQAFTAVGAVLGTPDYMSPEQTRGRQVDARSDLYSAGVALFQILAGRVPFEGKDSIAILRHHVETPAPRMGEFSEGVPTELERIVARLLAKKPEGRYPHVQALEADLAAAFPEDEPSARTVRDLMASADAAAGGPTGTTEPVSQRSEPAESEQAAPARRDRAEGSRAGACVAVGAATVAVIVLIFAMAALVQAILENRARARRRPGPPVAAQRALWRVELRNGEVRRGVLLPSTRGPDGELVFVLRGREGEAFEIPHRHIRFMKKERGGETR